MSAQIGGVILAGGRATRMNGNDKGLITLAGKPLYQHVIERFSPQVTLLLINANRYHSDYQHSGLAVFSDLDETFSGPLAGMLAAFHQPQLSQFEWIAFTSCDAPQLPDDLVSRLWQQRGDALAVYADDGERSHPTLCLLHRSIIDKLDAFLKAGDRKLMLFLHSVPYKRVDFSDKRAAFKNLNTPEDCHLFEAELSRDSSHA